MDLIFVHGALVRDGEWWWRPTAELLGMQSHSLELPSCDGGGGLAEDAAALRALLDDVGSAIVVGHSYGGTVVSEAGPHPAVSQLFLISSYLPDAGTAQAQIMADEPDPAAIAPNEDGTLSLVADLGSFTARFMHDAPSFAEGAFALLAPQSAAAFVTPTTAEGWRGVDSTYLVCVDDRSTSIALQRHHAARATRSIDLPTGHHPFLSRPDLVAAAITANLL